MAVLFIPVIIKSCSCFPSVHLHVRLHFNIIVCYNNDNVCTVYGYEFVCNIVLISLIHSGFNHELNIVIWHCMEYFKKY